MREAASRYLGRTYTGSGMPDLYEKYIRWYLRLNGFLSVENFIAHADGDPTRQRGRLVGQRTELDVIGVRFPFA